MKHRIATVAAATLLLASGLTMASSASAGGHVSVAIGLPGFAVGYGPGYYAPPLVAYASPVTYYGAPYYSAPVAYAAGPVFYGSRVVYGHPYYRPYYRGYYRHY
jgi:hypothetical protein